MAEASREPSDFPPCKILVRSKEGLEIYEISEKLEDVKQPEHRPFLCRGATSIPFVTSPDGSHVYVHVTGQGIRKCHVPDSLPSTIAGENNVSFLSEDTKGVQMMDVSPNGNYLLTWERWNETSCPNNLRVWETATGKMVAAFAQRNIKRTAWPYLQWTHDESMAALLTTNEIRFFPVTNFTGEDPLAVRYSDKIRIANVSSISVPQSSTIPSDNNQPSYLFTAFVPATKDKPARAGLYRFIPGSTKPDAPPTLSKSLFQAEDMKVDWSPGGDAALLTLQTAVDTSGQSYYGSSQLFLMRYGEPDVVAVPLPQEGPVASVGWLPDPKQPPCFVTVAGKSPALASLHHGKSGKTTFLFGNAHRNVVSWSPHGRFLCLAGFGNLAGGMSFWDRNKQKLINNGCMENASGQLRVGAPVVGYDWAPSSRWFLCSTCSPRMNVDNGIRLFRYNGQPVTTVPWKNEQYQPDKLLQAEFVPAKLSVYPDRPQSPPPEGFDLQAASTATTTSVTPSSSAHLTAASRNGAASSAVSSSGAYVPPSARNRAGGSSLAERLRREKEGNLQTASRVMDNKVKTPQGERVIVGMAPSAGTQGKSKSALKREKEKKKKQQQQEEEQQKQEAAAAAAAAPSQDDPEKRARKIKKTLKQIDELKQKDVSSLNDDQKAKVASEDQLRAELEQLGM